MDVDNIFIGLIMFASTLIAWEYFSAAETKNQVMEKVIICKRNDVAGSEAWKQLSAGHLDALCWTGHNTII